MKVTANKSARPRTKARTKPDGVRSKRATKDQSSAGSVAPTSFAHKARAGLSTKRGEVSAEVLGHRALRTRDHLIETAKTLFLERGYGGTTIDHIADAAGVSRASFYTYFPSKRETLLAAGEKGQKQSIRTLTAIAEVPQEWTLEDLKSWISAYLQYLNEHGAFLIVWSQAAWNDKELRSIGARATMRVAGIMGTELQRLGMSHHVDPRIQGQALMAMIDRFWYMWRVTNVAFSEADVISGLAQIMASMLRGSGETSPIEARATA